MASPGMEAGLFSWLNYKSGKNISDKLQHRNISAVDFSLFLLPQKGKGPIPA
jgi:hypothetical protein